jgi:excisionase family DNA binding protein
VKPEPKNPTSRQSRVPGFVVSTARPLMTTQDVARALQCSERYVRYLIRAGALRVFKPSAKLLRVYPDSVEDFVSARSFGGASRIAGNAAAGR